MRKPDTLRLHPTEKLEAFRLELRAFVTNLLIWIVDTLDAAPKRSLLRTLMQTPPLAAALREARRTIARDLRASVHDLKIYLLALAFIRTAPMIQKRSETHTKRPASVPPGFRRARQRAVFHRHLIGDTLKDFHRGSFRTRAERIRDALDHPERYVANISRRIVATLHHAKAPALLLICAHDVVRKLAPTRTLEAADSS